MSNPSLIKIADQQLPLFGSDQMDPALFAVEESSEQREFTGARLFSANPDTYRAIVALSAEGLGAIRIGKILHVSPNTVLAVRAREPESVDIEKRRLAGLSREGARMCVEGILELLCDPVKRGKLTLKDMGIVNGILVDKSQDLSGSPTARLQIIGTPAAVEVIEYMRWLKTEYDRRMGFGEGKEEQREVAALLAPAIEAEVLLALADPGAAEAVPGPGEDQDQLAIVAPGENGEAECSVGQTTHRIDGTPVNIDLNESDRSAGDAINKLEVIKDCTESSSEKQLIDRNSIMRREKADEDGVNDPAPVMEVQDPAGARGQAGGGCACAVAPLE